MDVHGRDLRYFVAVAEELHFTRAAERLYLSQPALSKQIRMLERQLGAELFERDRQGVALTPVGVALLPHARRVLAAWDEARAAAEQAKSEQRATLLVGMSTSLARSGMLPAIRSRFTAMQPGATVALREVGWEDPTAGLAGKATDVAFVWLPLPDPGGSAGPSSPRNPAWSPCRRRRPRAQARGRLGAPRSRLTSLTCSTSRSWHCRAARGRCGTTGWPPTPETASRQSSGRRSPALARPTRR